MGISQLLKNQPADQLTPGRAFIVALLYMISADGEIDGEEVSHLLTILGGVRERGSFTIHIKDQDTLNWAISYRSRNSIDNFLNAANLLLSQDQKRCLLLNLVDCAVVDGMIEPQEEELFNKFLETFEITLEQFKPWYDLIIFKNSYQIFFAEEPNDITN